ncbi:TonB-dependent receptor plug domain-containing protein [Carboxylicivirga sp. N1Y90]|uniref:TonB-dependent receptor plug domain-containing protein n=1 Tax=Carboxylicivirga fragile TaxID=3417571 RepID=UPI003D343F87|nr:TonB-dependent receptor plug domain-containing protein [Marinilabiliaceae bacterium N1Y90]
MKISHILFLVFALLIATISQAQETSKKYTREQVLNMTTEEMSSLPLEELMSIMDVVGVSSMEELYDLLLNKDVTSASKKAESLFEAPLSTTVLSKEEISASGATSIEEALRLVPGVIVREKTNGNYDVHIRGLDNLPPGNMMLQSENNSTLLMINGRPVFNYAMGGVLWESLPIGLGDIERIEVVRGPSSALYGPNAVSGAINIITKQITSESPLLSVNAQGGNMSTFIGDLGLRKQLNEKFAFGVTANYERRDRTTDKLYVFNEKESFTKEEFNKLTFNDIYGNTYQYVDPKDDINELFAEPGLSREKTGVNAMLNYKISEKAVFDLSAGHQNSYVNSSTLGDNSTSISGRESKTSYVDFNGDVYGFAIKANYLFGMQDFNKGNQGFKTDMGQFNSSLEYDWQLNNLNIRPGVGYMSVFYDDTEYLPSADSNLGFFNGKNTLNVFSSSLRFDYKATEKLRLIAALRAEQYSKPDTWKASWQFVSAYTLNENNHLRLVYSRANRSPFILETSASFIWDREGRPSPNFIHFTGNENMEIMTSDLIEFGYRTRPAKNVMIDFEAYYSKSKNFTALVPESTNVKSAFGMKEHPLYPGVYYPEQPDNPKVDSEVRSFLKYENLALESTQMGASINVDWIISEKLIAKGHFTYQKTTLDNYNPVTRDDQITLQVGEVIAPGGLLEQQVIADATSGKIPFLPNYSMVSATSNLTADQSNFKSGFTHEATPSFWGNIGLDYKPTAKWQFYTNGYFYGKQTFINQYDTFEISQKFILNMKANYKVSETLSVFVNARNMLNDHSTEFAFLDKPNGLYLVGLKLNL